MFDNLKKLDRPWEAVDRELASRMASYWVSFIQSGDPNADGLPPWPSDREHVMRLGPAPRAEVLPAPAARQVLSPAFAP